MDAQERDGCVEWFSGYMREKLNEPRNVAKGTWRNEHVAALEARLYDEVRELSEALSEYANGRKNEEAIIREAADVANFALIIADRIRQSV